MIFKAEILLDRFPIKKNSKNIYINKRTGKRFIGSNNRALGLINKLNSDLLRIKLINKLEVINFDINVKMTFVYPKSEYLTKKGLRSSKIGDLSNLYQAVEDSLQKVGIIKNDSLICGHDGSRRILGEDKHLLIIEITKV